MGDPLTLNLGKWQGQVDHRLDRWEAQNFARRLWSKDPGLWHPEPQPEIIDRLGWLTLPESMPNKCQDILSFSHQIKKEGFAQILLLGMGGSSLAAEVFQQTFGHAPGYPELFVLDSTHPAGIIAVEKKLNLAQTLVLVSSKSGTTLETISLFRYFWSRIGKNQNNPGRFFAAITDAGSPLERIAKENNFRQTFLSSSDVGGRYSAFTEFGLVPAALIGLDIQALLEKGRIASEDSVSQGAEKTSSGFILGAALGELAQHKDKLTIWTTDSLRSFPAWLEQLLAESTGKQNKGIVPIVDEPFVSPKTYSQDRAFTGIFFEGDHNPEMENMLIEMEALGHPTIRITLREKLDLGLEFFRWELATASAGAILGIHPFNQPDVQIAKDLTRSTMEKDHEEMEMTERSADSILIQEEDACAAAIRGLFSRVLPGDYIAVQAFLPPSPEISDTLQNMRNALFKHARLPTTLGFGPRFLHSTGQLHKGGPNTVHAIQVVDEPAQDIPVPDTDYTFAGLIEAQSIGDFRALQQRKRRVLRINLGQNACEGLQKLEGFIIRGE
jgi:transaldolase/glucose-6-phosphate isomerase